MKKIKLIFEQFFCNHQWDKTRGWYDEPKKGATCLKCEKVYE